MRIGLFVTCLTDTLFPGTGQAVVAVLERLGHQVEFPAAQTCCGQMHFNTGYRREATPMARGFTAAFGGYEAVVAPSASCASWSARSSPRWPPRRATPAWPGPSRKSGPGPGDFGVPGRRARGDRHGRLLPAPGDLPPELSFAAHAPRRGCPAPPAARRPRPGSGGPARCRVLLRVRRDVLGEERRRSAAICADKVAAVRRASAEVLCAADNSCLMHIGGALTRQRSGVATMHLAEILARTDADPTAAPR